MKKAFLSQYKPINLYGISLIKHVIVTFYKKLSSTILVSQKNGVLHATLFTIEVIGVKRQYKTYLGFSYGITTLFIVILCMLKPLRQV